MKSIKLVAFVFLLTTLAIGCTKEDDIVAPDEQEKEQVDQKNDETNEEEPGDTEEQPSENPDENNNGEASNNDNTEDTETPGNDNNNSNTQPDNDIVPPANNEPENSGASDNNSEAAGGSGSANAVANILKGKVEIYHDNIKLGQASAFKVELLNSKGTAAMSTTTKADGSYTFNNIPKGTYSVRVSKDGYYNRGYSTTTELNNNVKKYTFGATSSTINADLYIIYKKSAAKVTAVKWYQGTQGVHMDIDFEGLDLPKDEKYVYIYVFVGDDKTVSKDKYRTKLMDKNNYGRNGYVKAWIPVSEIKDNKLRNYWVSDFCSWRGKFGAWGISPLPKYYAIYVTTTIVKQDYFTVCGDQYSGIAKTGLVVGDYGTAIK